ncbi:hypothetical protein INR49_017168 [Caranx melampygus]|nr:hypothetical protein INR49_017168 [Caranx melampygus]
MSVSFHLNFLIFFTPYLFFFRMEDEETETSVLKSELMREPDLLSDVSEMKQDLIKMTAILTADSTEKSPSLGGCGLEKGTEDISGEPLEIMEKDLEKVKEDLEKVSEILRSGTYEGEEAAKAARMSEEWVLLSDSEIEEAKKMAALEIQEPILRESRTNRGAPRPKAIKDSGDLKEYLLDAPVTSKVKAKKEPASQERFTDVVLRKSAKPATPTKVLDKTTAGDVKKPVRRKGKDQGQPEESTEGSALLSVPAAPAPASPVSPVVEETPIGSIKDKVKALQQKVEAEQKSKKLTGSKPSQLPVVSKSSPKAKESPKSKQAPPKSPKPESEKLEETMSVKELMQAFQTGQDPSKRKSGLFELKTSTVSRTERTTKSETTKSKSMTKAVTSRVSQQREVSLDSKPGKKETVHRDREDKTKSVAAAHPELTETVDFGNGGLDDSSDSLKHEGVADSLSGSSGDGTPHLSSEDSYKHEGLATPGTSPESLCLSPKTGQQASTTSASATTTLKTESKDTEKSGDSGVGASGDQLSTEMTLPVSSSEAADDHITSESLSVRSESKPSKPQKLTKRISETVETFLSDDESPDRQLALSLVGSPASRSSSQRHESLELPLKQDSDALSPLADDSLTISHRDSLEGSPLMDENSSHKSPDSIEPSPTNESPPHDSLEGSPVEQKSHPSFPGPPSKSSSHPEPSKAREFPQDAMRGRLLRDHEASADDDSCEQTSQMTSSGKSPLSPDTPSSEEVSYEVNPRPPDHTFLSVPFTPAVIPEDPEEEDTSDSYGAKTKITPEEEMFKMAAKIKTFDEMEQEAKSKKNSRKDLSAAADAKIGDDSYETLEPTSEELAQNTENRTDEQKEECLRKSRENRGDDKDGQGLGATLKPGSNVTDEVKEDHRGHTPAPEAGLGAAVPTDQTKEIFKPEVCIYDDTEEDDEGAEPPRTESKGVTAKVDADSWSAMREDDATFAARVKEEEQKILNLVVDRQSLQATPDTTPGRTPTEESTPTSEPNPFLFQEGKLFEMTRSGAIDMTKRRYEEEGGGFAFFQIGEQPLEEPLLEEAGHEGSGSAAEPEVGLNLTLEVKTEEEEKSQETKDSQLQSSPEGDQTTSKADAAKSKIPKMGISASAKSTKKDETSPECLETKTEKDVGEVSLDLDTCCSDEMITNVETAETTVTRSVYSEQGQESSDSSPEEPQSVIEAPKPTGKSKQSVSSGTKKAPGKTQAKSSPQSGGKSTSHSPSHATVSSTTLKKEASFTSESKSRIPIKASTVKPESTAKRAESTQDKKLKVPAKKDTRRKSETDAGPSVDVKIKTPSSKAKSFCEGESTRPSSKKDQGRPLSAESAKSKGFQSRLPVRGKSGQSSQSSTPTKEKSGPRKKSTDFFEEISDEAAKLVARLAQAETEKEQEAATANSDDESSLIDPSIIEREPFPEMQFPPSGDIFPIRPLWDDPVETQMQRIPDDKVQIDPQDEAERKEQRLAIIADHLGFSWTELARELEFSEERINLIRIENPNSLQDQSHALLKFWAEGKGQHVTELTLIESLTKINRMDIVHLIETKINKSTQEETSSHTYAEIERTIALDHSEGFSALHDDIDSPRPGRRTEPTRRSPGSGQDVPMVSAEDLSSSLSSLHDTTGRSEADPTATGLLRNAQKEKLQREMETTFSSQRIYEEIVDPEHTGSYKQVSPLFTLYCTSPYKLQSHVLDPVLKGAHLGVKVDLPPCPAVEPADDGGAAGYEGAEGGEEWSLECLQTTHSEYNSQYLSPLPWRESSNQSRTGVCESRPLSMTDFEDSLTECEQAEQDFRKLSIELTGTDEVPEKDQGSVSEQMLQTTSEPPPVSVTALTERTQTKQMASKHMDEVSHRLYKVLYGYDVELRNSDDEDVSVNAFLVDETRVGVREGEAEHEIDVHRVTTSGEDDVRSSDDINQTQGTTPQEPAGTSDVRHTIGSLASQKVEVMSSTSFTHVLHDTSFEETLSLRQNEPEDKVVLSVEYTSEIEASTYKSFVAESTDEAIFELHSLVHHGASPSECVTETAVLLTESRASSPESTSLVSELKFLGPDSQVPQFRPLSPLPPPVFPWETSDAEPTAQGQTSLSAPGGTSMLCTSESEERPLTPMVSNTRPFGPSVSRGSDYSSERSISPQLLSFDIEDRFSSPESAAVETEQWLFTSTERASPDLHEMRSLSPKSMESVPANHLLPLDPHISEFGQDIPEASVTCEYRSFSPESVPSDKYIETEVLLSAPFEDRQSPESLSHENIALVPASVAEDESESVETVIEHGEPSPESTECAEIVCRSILTGQSEKSPKQTLVFEAENKPPTSKELGSKCDNGWVFISLSDIEETALPRSHT